MPKDKGARPRPKKAEQKGRFKKPETPKRAVIPQAEIFSFKPKWILGKIDWFFSCDKLEAAVCTHGRQTSDNSPKIECCLQLLTERFKSFESMTWRDIIINDKLGSHFIQIEELRQHNNDLAKKFESLAIEGAIDEPFSFRLGYDDRL